MAEAFAAAGYQTALFGKWHLGDSFPNLPHYRGFQQSVFHLGWGITSMADVWQNDYFDGRFRTNVWSYAGVNTFKRGREAELAWHPTVKPVALVKDAIRDCSKPQGIILDPFGGSGTTLIAAAQTQRRGYLMELDPRYVDVTIKRWQDLFGAAVQLARRVCDAADAGQIRVSNVVRELCVGKDIGFNDLGQASLRGFDGPVHMHEVRWS